MEDDLIKRLARACAHGSRQLGFVNELLIGEGYRGFNVIGRQQYSYYGDSHVTGQSWKSLKKRLTAMGFIIKLDYDNNTVTMRFSA